MGSKYDDKFLKVQAAINSGSSPKAAFLQYGITSPGLSGQFYRWRKIRGNAAPKAKLPYKKRAVAAKAFVQEIPITEDQSRRERIICVIGSIEDIRKLLKEGI